MNLGEALVPMFDHALKKMLRNTPHWTLGIERNWPFHGAVYWALLDATGNW
jgi:hypothetical protein